MANIIGRKIICETDGYPEGCPSGAELIVCDAGGDGDVRAQVIGGDGFEWWLGDGEWRLADDGHTPITLEVGKRYELNNGEVHECIHMYGDDSLRVDQYGFGPFKVGRYKYHQDGRFADCGADHELSVKRCVDEETEDPYTYITQRPGEPGPCGDYEEAILLSQTDTERRWKVRGKLDEMPPAPVVREVVLYTHKGKMGGQRHAQEGLFGVSTHRITFTTIDGKPDCASVKMEEL